MNRIRRDEMYSSIFWKKGKTAPELFEIIFTKETTVVFGRFDSKRFSACKFSLIVRNNITDHARLFVHDIMLILVYNCFFAN